MRRMFSEKQIENLIAEGITGKDINVEGITSKGISNTGNIASTGDISGGSLSIGTTNIKNLFVKIMSAPESTTLTDEQIARISEGVFINGEFLGYKNPVLFPPSEEYGSLSGVIIGRLTGNKFRISRYGINSSKVISANTAQYFEFDAGNSTSTIKALGIILDAGGGTLSLRGKNWPSNPADTGTFTLKCVNGVLTWVADE